MAIQNAQAGDTLIADADNYSGNYTINVANLTIQGANAGVGPDETRAAGSIVTTGFNITASNVTIDGFDFTGSVPGNEASAIFLLGSGAIIRNNSLVADANADTGIVSGGGGGGHTIAENVISGYGAGIYVNATAGPASKVQGNEFNGNSDGLVFEDGPSVNNVTNNEFSGSTRDVRVSFRTAGPDDLSNVVTNGNSFSGGAVAPFTILASGASVVTGTAQNDTLMTGPAGGSYQFIGASFTLNGGAGADLFISGAGNDTLNGGTGADTFSGSAQTLTGDTIVDFGASDRIVVTGATANATVSFEANTLTIDADGNGGAAPFTIALEGQTAGTYSIDDNGVVTFVAATPPTTPTAGPDNLVGTAGDDTTTAGTGNDTVASGQGNDNVFGNEGNDQVFGNEGNDSVYGGQGDDSAFGGQGDDAVQGNLGNDSVQGNKGNDEVLGNQGNDTVLGNEGNDVVHGGQNDDFVHGGQGNDTVNGGLGNDTVNGGLGDDIVSGGGGSDLFVFVTGQGDDTVTDFGMGDILDLQGQTYTLTTAQDGSAVLDLSGGGSITLTGVAFADFDDAFVA